MAAGLGFKDFTTGEVLTAADVDGYLMQGVWVFASAAARDAAVTSPQEGNFAYLKDTNVTTYYTGSAWANLDTTGMTNPMTTTGDTIYSSSGSTPARLGIGTAGQVLTVNSGATAPEWATPAAGGGANWSLLNTGGTNLSGSTTTVSGISGADKIMVIIDGASSASASSAMLFRLNTDSGSNYIFTHANLFIANTYAASNFSRSSNFSGTSIPFADTANNASGDVTGYLLFSGCNAAGLKAFNYIGAANAGGASNQVQNYGGGLYAGTSTISSVSLISNTGNFDAGKIYVYTSA